tara:strand:- start:134 stop:562 length:429 start_codon:yes stop_codon:yes gene_type:complete
LPGHNYQIQLQYTPLGESSVECISNSLRKSFDVAGHNIRNDILLLDIASNFPLGYGALKDMADLIIDELSSLNINLLNAVIQRVDPGPAGLFADGKISRLIGKMISIKHHTPLMYFYQNMIIDLQLSSRVKRINMSPVAELN